ncbi:hypothetical protein GWK47_022700 [Chionoecetes opilio]|uniref:Uncharacterized protein n=1 Tax=Chionoecetes opilio TaxID=41210 RepID=A0A8J4XMK8_CHIOP|nr:hypothetical protein GWK47_022700 [Chionoecetes opilio]
MVQGGLHSRLGQELGRACFGLGPPPSCPRGDPQGFFRSQPRPFPWPGHWGNFQKIHYPWSFVDSSQKRDGGNIGGPREFFAPMTRRKLKDDALAFRERGLPCEKPSPGGIENFSVSSHPVPRWGKGPPNPSAVLGLSIKPGVLEIFGAQRASTAPKLQMGEIPAVAGLVGPKGRSGKEWAPFWFGALQAMA